MAAASTRKSTTDAAYDSNAASASEERVPVGSLILWIHQLKRQDAHLLERINHLAEQHQESVSSLRKCEHGAQDAGRRAQDVQTLSDSLAQTVPELQRTIVKLQEQMQALEQKVAVQPVCSHSSETALESRVCALEQTLKGGTVKTVSSTFRHMQCPFKQHDNRIIPSTEDAHVEPRVDPLMTTTMPIPLHHPSNHGVQPLPVESQDPISTLLKQYPEILQESEALPPELRDNGDDATQCVQGDENVHAQDDISTVNSEHERDYTDLDGNDGYAASMDLGFASQQEPGLDMERDRNVTESASQPAQQPQQLPDEKSVRLEPTASEQDLAPVHTKPHLPPPAPAAPQDPPNPVPPIAPPTSSNRLTRAQTRGHPASALDAGLADPESLLRGSQGKKPRAEPRPRARDPPLRTRRRTPQRLRDGGHATRSLLARIRTTRPSEQTSTQELALFNQHDLLARDFVMRSRLNKPLAMLNMPATGAELFWPRRSPEPGPAAYASTNVYQTPQNRMQRRANEGARRAEPGTSSSRADEGWRGERARRDEMEGRQSQSPNPNAAFWHWQPKRPGEGVQAKRRAEDEGMHAPARKKRQLEWAGTVFARPDSQYDQHVTKA